MELSHGTVKDLPEIDKLLSAHHSEVDWTRLQFKPDWTTYLTLIDKKIYHLFVARINGELVGYAGFFIVNHLHYQVLVANCDLVYVKPFFRGTGHNLIKYCDDELKKLNVKIVIHSVTWRKDFSPTLVKQGYKKIETNWGKLFF